MALTQTHIIEQHFYTQRSSSKIALLHKKPAGPLLHFIFFPKQLKANLIRINYISHGLQGFKQCLFNLIFFFFFFINQEPVSNLHMKVVAHDQISGHRRLSVCVCVCELMFLCSRPRASEHCVRVVSDRRGIL